MGEIYITLPLSQYEAMQEEIKTLRSRKDAPMPDIEDIPFLDNKLYGFLQRAGIKNISEVEQTTLISWTRTPGFGRKTYARLKEIMTYYGLSFKD